jgi:hypothetical protein
LEAHVVEFRPDTVDTSLKLPEDIYDFVVRTWLRHATGSYHLS